MKSRTDDLFIYDIIEACESICTYLDGVERERFDANRMIQDAVVRNIEIIGEAAKNISEDTRNKYPTVAWREIARMRDKIVHHYFRLNMDIVWQTATVDIPDLLEQLRRPADNRPPTTDH